MSSTTVARNKSKPLTQPLPARTVLQTLLSPEGIYASGDTLFKNAIFGRDSLEVAEDVMASQPDLAKQIIRTIASLQGTIHDPVSEEEPGRIHHEYRALHLGDTKTNPTSQRILEAQVAKWGGNPQAMIYYGSVDATPLYIRVIDRFCQQFGRDLLAEMVVNKDGEQITLESSLTAAIRWLVDRIQHSPLGLLEFSRQNPRGHKIQTWKDSAEFYLHADSSPAYAPIASIEVQGLAYDALLAAANYWPSEQQNFQKLAKVIQKRVVHDMWLEDEQFFALGFDHTDQQPRLIKTITANPAELLDTKIFDNLPAKQKQQRLKALVRRIFADDFLTNAGIRSRSLKHGNLAGFWDYHGSFVTWPKETFDIAKGLHRQGFSRLARSLQHDLQNICLLSHSYPEFVYVDETGALLIRRIDHSQDEHIIVFGTSVPERTQAWTISALVAIESDVFATTTPQTAWQKQLEDSVYHRIPEGHKDPAGLLTATYRLINI